VLKTLTIALSSWVWLTGTPKEKGFDLNASGQNFRASMRRFKPPGLRCRLQDAPWRLSLKIKATAKGLQSWSDRKVGNFIWQLDLAREIVHQLEIARDGRQLSPLEIWLHNNLKKLSLALSSLLRTVARIRSRIHWLRNGDANTSLFHAHARYRQKKNFIANLKDGEQVVTSHEGKAQLLWDFYSELLGAPQERPYSLNLVALGLQMHDLSSVPISEDEVLNTIKHMPNDKTPGLDDLTWRFYKSY
jgi:hypothetical protein